MIMADALETNDNFGPLDLGYGPSNAYREWFVVPTPPRGGWKIHLSCRAEDAETIAQFVLSILRGMRVKHKVCHNLTTYRRQLSGKQRGKFITIYTDSHKQAQRVVDEIDPKLLGLRPGPVPFARDIKGRHTGPEIRVGKSGMLYTRYVDSYSS
jgi:hypothetical protein